jgi:prepilin-type N-terminal cleavage/methylation domain-containing protein
MILHTSKTAPNQKAFTIIELMIATSILAIILLLVTTMMISIGNLYYKGTTQASLQDNVRNITDEISQDLQLNGSALITGTNTNPNLPRSYCIGTTRYTYILGKELSTSPGAYQSYHVLWRSTVPAGTCPDIVSATFNATSLSTRDPGTELIGPSSMLTSFTITTGASPFTITINEAYGSNSLLCDTGTDTGAGGACNTPTATSNHIWDPNPPVGQVVCRGFTGTQFCSTAGLTVTVSERL